MISERVNEWVFSRRIGAPGSLRVHRIVDRCVGASWTPTTGSAMDLARYVVDAVVLEGRTYREVAAAHGVSKSYVGALIRRRPNHDTMRVRAQRAGADQASTAGS